MRFVEFKYQNQFGIGVLTNEGVKGFLESDPNYPGNLQSIVNLTTYASTDFNSKFQAASSYEADAIEFLPPIKNPTKILCVGLNYVDHSTETGFEPPKYPTIFARFSSSLLGHQAPIIRPKVSKKLDFEGELAVVIGKAGKNISKDNALDHVFGYSIFNDASLRDYQIKSPQWTMGKNFDSTGAFGPCLVTKDELPAGCKGLKLETRLNGEIMQQANTNDMIFDVATLIYLISEVMTLNVGDVIVTGTPAGIGWARKPSVFMKQGDMCEIEIEKMGMLINKISDEDSIS